MSLAPELIKVSRRCKKSATFFIENFAKIKHPTMGVLPFKLFGYQKKSLSEFRDHRFNLIKKCRQSGLSTLCGAFALWMAMFFNYKTILIVSRSDAHAKEFLNRNVKFIYNNLPEWMRNIWVPTVLNEHQIGFPNGSTITSLTSAPNVLRSHASSLNIIDEVAHIDHMSAIWTAGWSTLQHGGQVISLSTPNGIGGWYWQTWTDALEKLNDFNPIEIKWWDMDWVLEYVDDITHKKMRIAPTDNLRKTVGKIEYDKYGPYWSPWLEGEFRGLQKRGKGHLFKQEVLADFLGSGGTVLSPSTIRRVYEYVENSPDPKIVNEIIPYIHPINGQTIDLDLTVIEDNDGLYVWEEPIHPTPPRTRRGRIVRQGAPGHAYVMGVDVASGKNDDYSAIEVFDITTQEQVAEFAGKMGCIPFSYLVDYIGRWYNGALVVIESTGIGEAFIQNVEELAYPNLWRRKVKVRKGTSYNKKAGFPTTTSGKPTLNKALADNLSDEEGIGYIIRSSRLAHQFSTYIKRRNAQGFETGKTEAQQGDHDDLVIACALALHGKTGLTDSLPLTPLSMARPNLQAPGKPIGLLVDPEAAMKQLQNVNDPRFLMPIQSAGGAKSSPSTEEQLNKFTKSLVGGAKQNKQGITITKKKYFDFYDK